MTLAPLRNIFRIPELRGRVAYDVRFELYDKSTLDRIVRYDTRRGDWKSIVEGYRVVLVGDLAHLEALAAEPGAKVVFHDDEIAVVTRGVVATR